MQSFDEACCGSTPNSGFGCLAGPMASRPGGVLLPLAQDVPLARMPAMGHD